MYAVVSTGGKQLKVEKGTEAVIERIDASVGDSVTLDVLFVTDGEAITAGGDAAGATVKAEVVEHFLGDKVVVFKFKRRKGYKRTKGHRQSLTRVKITEIASGTGARKVAKKAEAKPEKPAAKVAEKPAKPEKPAAKVEMPAAKAAEKPAKAAKKPEAKAEKAAAQCEAVKANGERCQNKAKEGSSYCGVHAKKYED
ncbi:MAG: 50S ribosomal protein L21 [Coriobacteriia bacterium]|nr:50S ribosomal protein L21 [Coriobacteriia bacterium]